MELSTKQFGYWAKTRTFAAEISDLRIPRPGWVRLVSAVTGKKLDFAYAGVDRDASGEDIAGWRYRNAEHRLTLLIIND